MKVTFDHISLRAKNLEEMKDFLMELLDLKIGFRPAFSFRGYWLYSKDVEKALIHMYDEDASFYKKDLLNENFKQESAGKNIINHICFFSDNHEETMERISELDADYSINHVPNSPIEQIFVRAPENLIVEIQATPKEKKNT